MLRVPASRYFAVGQVKLRRKVAFLRRQIGGVGSGGLLADSLRPRPNPYGPFGAKRGRWGQTRIGQEVLAQRQLGQGGRSTSASKTAAEAADGGDRLRSRGLDRTLSPWSAAVFILCGCSHGHVGLSPRLGRRFALRSSPFDFNGETLAHESTMCCKSTAYSGPVCLVLASDHFWQARCDT